MAQREIFLVLYLQALYGLKIFQKTPNSLNERARGELYHSCLAKAVLSPNIYGLALWSSS